MQIWNSVTVIDVTKHDFKKIKIADGAYFKNLSFLAITQQPIVRFQ